jgi:beta-lactamase class A
MKLIDAIEKMIVVSDNYAALLVANKSGTFSVTSFLKSYGFNGSNFKQPPQTTASDIANYFEKLYKGEIVDQEYSSQMMEILKKQTLNDRIPANLPEDTVVAHKTGELFGAKHDGGIVFTENGDYIIVVMSDTKDVKEAILNTANFSEEIYDYFQNTN